MLVDPTTEEAARSSSLLGDVKGLMGGSRGWRTLSELTSWRHSVNIAVFSSICVSSIGQRDLWNIGHCVVHDMLSDDFFLMQANTPVSR